MTNDKKQRKLVIQRIVWGLGSVMFILALFFVLVLVLRKTLDIPFSLWINFWILVWLASLIIFIIFVKKRKSVQEIYGDHFALFVLQILFLTIILHYIGGIDSLGLIFYTFFMVYGIFLLPRKYGLAIVLISSIFISGLTLFEYNDILPHVNLFIGRQPHKDLDYIIVRLIIVFSTFGLLTFAVNKLSEEMKQQSKELLRAQLISDRLNKELQERLSELEKARSDLEESKATLEVKVKARTKELEELTDSLENEVKRRTKELQVKVEELEKFQKFAVGREMKMVELKQEIDKLKSNKKQKQ